MNNLERYIWIEAEQWAAEKWDVEDVNTDVIVFLSNRA